MNLCLSELFCNLSNSNTQMNQERHKSTAKQWRLLLFCFCCRWCRGVVCVCALADVKKHTKRNSRNNYYCGTTGSDTLLPIYIIHSPHYSVYGVWYIEVYRCLLCIVRVLRWKRQRMSTAKDQVESGKKIAATTTTTNGRVQRTLVHSALAIVLDSLSLLLFLFLSFQSLIFNLHIRNRVRRSTCILYCIYAPL